MKPILHCEFEYIHRPHLSQIYAGLFLLEKKGIISCSVRNNYQKAYTGHLTVIINKKIKVVFDLIDGYSDQFPKGKDKIENFQKEIESFQAHFYFKRSYLKEFQKEYPNGCKVLPLGLNYYVDDGRRFRNGNLKEDIKDEIRNIKFLRELLKAEKNAYHYSFYEQYPIHHQSNKILFLTRLWNPEDINLPHMKEDRLRINESRIKAIELCKKEFGDLFIGGIDANQYTQKNYKNLVFPYSFTNKKSYIKTMKSSNICIATTGLNDSIGWKFGEYVAASRCIITEPLVFSLPGDFRDGQNYLSYASPEKLIENIQILLDNKKNAVDMMLNNYQYYNNYVRPDNLVFNALTIILNETIQ